MPLANVGLRFDNGLVVGKWDIPNPQTRPAEFNRVAESIGFHVALEISRGATGCHFIDMEDERQNRKTDSIATATQPEG